MLLVHLFVYLACADFFPFSLPLGVRDWLLLVIVALPGLFYSFSLTSSKDYAISRNYDKGMTSLHTRLPRDGMPAERTQAELFGPRQVMTNFNCACPAIQRSQGSGFLSEGSS